MRERLLFIIVAAFLFSSFFFLPAQAVTTLTKGIEIGDWLNTDEAYYVQTTRYTLKDFQDIQSLGCDHVRLLVNFNTFGNREPDYQINQIFYDQIDKALSWANQLGMKVVVANTGEDLVDGSIDLIRPRFVTNWKNVATKYASTGDIILYELLVHPADQISAENWNALAAEAIAAIREVDQTHTIVVGPINWYSIDALASLQKFADNNILYAFEVYGPELFTQQGLTFHDVAYNTVVVPFPRDAGTVPAMDAADAGTVAETAYNNYSTTGTVDYVKGLVDQAAQWGTDNGVPVWCSSFGSTVGSNWNGTKGMGWFIPDAYRTAWHNAVRSECEAKGVAWTLTGYRGNFGIFFDYGTDPDIWVQFSTFPYDVNANVVESLGLTPPEIVPYIPEPLSEAFLIYDDEANTKTRLNWWNFDGEPNFFIDDNPASGKYCLGLLYPNQYCAVEFFFPNYLDMQTIKDDGWVLDFFVRCDDETGHIQARFEDTNDDLEERPWRMNFHVDNNVVPFDGDWQRVIVPLADMQDMGAWDPDAGGAWYGGGQGLPDWAFVQTFQFVSETGAQLETEIYVDRVRIVSSTAVDNEIADQPDDFRLAQNYPNPFNPSTTIEFSLGKNTAAELAIFNVKGELVKTLVSGKVAAGAHRLEWDGTNQQNLPLPSGVYFYELKADDQHLVQRMLLMR